MALLFVVDPQWTGSRAYGTIEPMAGFVGQVTVMDEDGVSMPVEAVLTGEHAQDENLAWWEGMLHTRSPRVHAWGAKECLKIRLPDGAEREAIIEKVQLVSGPLAIATIRGLGAPPFH